ncbi:crossover junction endodeoxyribonuclease RuvC [bacterium]|nr:crossover junction endodeoxyribonuclease RuvC [candidate division CSSED10-310 bacterium]
MTPHHSRINPNPEIVVGLDPGSRVSGIGIINSGRGRLTHIDHYPIRIPTTLTQADKLVTFAEKFQPVLDRYPTATLVIESLFTAKNVNSILKLSHVRGVAMMMAARAGWPVVELAPATIKVSVTGYGRATKEQVQYMVQRILKLSELPDPPDCADALAMAICYAGQAGLRRKMRMRS